MSRSGKNPVILCIDVVGGIRRGDFSESRPVPCNIAGKLGNRKLPFACEPGARPPRLGRSIEKDYKLNIDAQDAQDNQDGRLLQETLTRAMIAPGGADLRMSGNTSQPSPEKILCILCIDVNRCESNLMLDYEPVSSHQAQAFVSQVRPPPPTIRIIRE